MILWIESRLRGMLIPDGFPGQRLRVLPRPLVRTALSSPVTARLLVTDAGHFPHAAAHGRWRPAGAEEAIVMLCVEGAGRLQLADRMLTVTAGQAVVIPAGTGHRYWADEHDPWSIWWLHAMGHDVPDLVSAIVGEDEQLIVSVRDMFTAVDLVQQAVAKLEQDETTASLYLAAGVTWNLLAQLASDRLRGSASSTDRIQLVQDYLRQHLATPTDVSALARLAGLSTSHFSALFKASAGIGVVEYVKRLRGARARELLITTNAPIADIARAVGYSDAFYFSRQFRAINGTSPSEYRANHHGLRT
jgi:AraC family transcriptional regulator of arabinose operon